MGVEGKDQEKIPDQSLYELVNYNDKKALPSIVSTGCTVGTKVLAVYFLNEQIKYFK